MNPSLVWTGKSTVGERAERDRQAATFCSIQLGGRPRFKSARSSASVGVSHTERSGAKALVTILEERRTQALARAWPGSSCTAVIDGLPNPLFLCALSVSGLPSKVACSLIVTITASSPTSAKPRPIVLLTTPSTGLLAKAVLKDWPVSAPLSVVEGSAVADLTGDAACSLQGDVCFEVSQMRAKKHAKPRKMLLFRSSFSTRSLGRGSEMMKRLDFDEVHPAIANTAAAWMIFSSTTSSHPVLSSHSTWPQSGPVIKLLKQGLQRAGTDPWEAVKESPGLLGIGSRTFSTPLESAKSVHLQRRLRCRVSIGGPVTAPSSPQGSSSSGEEMPCSAPATPSYPRPEATFDWSFQADRRIALDDLNSQDLDELYQLERDRHGQRHLLPPLLSDACTDATEGARLIKWMSSCWWMSLV
ncbi:hypothetical protein WJX73_006052 [Symbiochloris irregularis]|uniref:Uncharacterized protein n=1 Tax=Symbiochloris irregularis TaxID=706552 RepID=A0AAW1P6K6_9CHLO